MSTITTPQAQNSNFIAWPSLIWIGALHVGALLAFVPAYFTWQALLLCVVLHWVSGGVGICLTYHRLLTHRSFVVRPRWLEYVLTAIGCTASEGGPIGWVADHRCHHAFSDQDGDVHSPNKGFGWAHMFWWMTPDVTSLHSNDWYEKWAPDLNRDPVHRWLDKYHILFPIGLFVLLYAIGGMPFLVWGGFVRAVTVLHTTWLVNSAAHIWGYRSHETRDKSTNLWWVALMTYGEGWHNNHHAYQTSAAHGLRWWEIDTTYWMIRVMQALGMAHTIKMAKVRKGQTTAPAGDGPAVLPAANLAADQS